MLYLDGLTREATVFGSASTMVLRIGREKTDYRFIEGGQGIGSFVAVVEEPFYRLIRTQRVKVEILQDWPLSTRFPRRTRTASEEAKKVAPNRELFLVLLGDPVDEVQMVFSHGKTTARGDGIS